MYSISGGKELCHTNTKDGPYIQEMLSLKAEEIKQFISSAKDHQKVEHPAIYQMGMLLVLTKEPAYHI